MVHVSSHIWRCPKSSWKSTRRLAPLHTRMAQSPWDDASGRKGSTQGLFVVALEPHCALLNSHLASALLGLDMVFFGSLTTQEASGMCICCAGSVPVLVC